tara:strand:+ start:2010 stop:3104 length:1095 start_codon:yes stop_codon:yes gene_type:complete
MDRIPWSVPEVGDKELNEIKQSFSADWLTMGPKVSEFESLMAGYLNVEHAIAVSNGTDAIDLALMAKDIKYGDEVIVPAMTYFSTGACVNRVGATPVYTDICSKTWNLNPKLIEDAITEKTKGIIFIDYGGNPADIDSILSIAKKNDLFVIQDAAQSLGGVYKDTPLGAQAEISTMSFHMAKILATVEGGMIFTHDDEIYEKLKKYRNHGESKKYIHEVLGTNARMTDITAGIGIAQFKKLDSFLKRRKVAAEIYDSYLCKHDIISKPQCIYENSQNANFLYSICVPDRHKVEMKLKEKNIDYRICYPMPLYKQPLYDLDNINCRYHECPVAEQISSGTISLPMFPSINESQIKIISETVLSAI